MKTADEENEVQENVVSSLNRNSKHVQANINVKSRRFGIIMTPFSFLCFKKSLLIKSLNIC